MTHETHGIRFIETAELPDDGAQISLLNADENAGGWSLLIESSDRADGDVAAFSLELTHTQLATLFDRWNIRVASPPPGY